MPISTGKIQSILQILQREGLLPRGLRPNMSSEDMGDKGGTEQQKEQAQTKRKVCVPKDITP